MINNYILSTQDIKNQLLKYNIIDSFLSEEEISRWISRLTKLQIKNILSLDLKPENIKFDSKLLIDNNLLNTKDYLKRINALVSINNADGWYHLFDRMLRPEFLNSSKFYQDIETLKQAECAQIPLWIIGESTFINSPYHDEDFELLVTSKDINDKKKDYVVWDAIATVSKNEESIRSCYHRKDLQTIVRYGSKSLQMSCTYPEGSINNLAVNPISLNYSRHLDDMEILAQNPEIGNFLYAVMTDKNTIRKNNYRRIIREMIDNKENKYYVFMVCYYAIGEKKAIDAQNICVENYFNEIRRLYNIEDLLKKIDERINVIDGDYEEIFTYGIECNSKNNIETNISNENLFQKIKKKIKIK